MANNELKLELPIERRVVVEEPRNIYVATFTRTENGRLMTSDQEMFMTMNAAKDWLIDLIMRDTLDAENDKMRALSRLIVDRPEEMDGETECYYMRHLTFTKNGNQCICYIKTLNRTVHTEYDPQHARDIRATIYQTENERRVIEHFIRELDDDDFDREWDDAVNIVQRMEMAGREGEQPAAEPEEGEPEQAAWPEEWEPNIRLAE